jgi:hypothetical protein
MYLKECSPLFECLNLNEYTDFYISVEDTYNEIMNLLVLQNNNILLTQEFIHTLYRPNVLNRSSGKKNFIEVTGPPSSYKTIFLILYVVLY